MFAKVYWPLPWSRDGLCLQLAPINAVQWQNWRIHLMNISFLSLISFERKPLARFLKRRSFLVSKCIPMCCSGIHAMHQLKRKNSFNRMSFGSMISERFELWKWDPSRMNLDHTKKLTLSGVVVKRATYRVEFQRKHKCKWHSRDIE